MDQINSVLKGSAHPLHGVVEQFGGMLVTEHAQTFQGMLEKIQSVLIQDDNFYLRNGIVV